MRFRSRWLMVSMGRAVEWGMDFGLYIGIGELRAHGPLYASWPVMITIRWNWLPRFYWQYGHPSIDPNAVWSASWTGRRRELVGVYWPAYFRVILGNTRRALNG